MNKSSLSPFIPNKEKYQKYVDEIYANGWVSNNGPELEEKDQNLILGIIKQKLKRRCKMRTQEEIDFLENYIPELANSAVKKAYLDTLSSGNSVLETIENKLYEVFPDGKKVFIKNVSKNVKIDLNKREFTL